MHPIRDEVCRVRGLRACIARLPSTFAGRLPFTMVACSAAQRSETAYLRVPVQRHDGWRLIPEITDGHHRGQGRVTARSCQSPSMPLRRYVPWSSGVTSDPATRFRTVLETLRPRCWSGASRPCRSRLCLGVRGGDDLCGHVDELA